MSLKNLFSSAGGASSDVIETEVVSTASIRDVFEDNSCIALYQFEGDATDTSGNFNGTASNVTYGAGKFGQCAVFNGSYMRVANMLNELMKSPYSISFYLKINAFPTGIDGNYDDYILYAQDNNNSHNSLVGVYILHNTQNLRIYSRTNNLKGVELSTQNILLNTYVHVAIVQDVSNIYVFLDGAISAQSAISTTFTTTADAALYVGAVAQEWISQTPILHFSGSIDQFRIFNRALTAEEVAFLYVEEKTVVKETVRELKDLVDPFLDKSGVALYKMDGNSQDAGGVYNGTPTNMSYTSGKFGDCGVFNGSSSRIDISQITYSSDNFTVSCWVKFNVINKEQRYVVLNSQTYNKYFRICCNSSGYMYVQYGATNSSTINSTSVATVGSWYHVVLTIIKDSNMSFYINGTLIESKGISGYGYAVDSLNVAKIGCGRDNTLGLNGSIDQVRVFNRALTTEEVSSLYIESKPQASTINLIDPFGDNSAVALYKMDGNALDVGGSYNGTASGVTYEEGKFGHCAVFNGTSANINTGYNYGSLFALSLWVKTTSSGWVASSYTSDTAGGGLTVEANVAKLEFGGGEGVIRNLYGTKVVNDGAWHHIVALSNGATGTIYVDGVLDVSSPFVHYNSSGNIYLGKRGTIANYFSGKMDQVRLFKRMLSQEEVEILYNEKPNDTTEEGLVAYYPLQVSAQDAQSTFEGTATNVAFDGDSAYFKGTSSQVSIPSIVSKFNTQNIFGVSLWFKGTQTSVPIGLFSVRSLQPDSIVFLVALNRAVAGDIGLDSAAAGGFITLGTYNGGFNNGVWHHCYVDINFTTKAFNIFVDGKLVSSGTNASLVKSTAAAYAYIGCNYLSQYFAGNLDEVRVYERTLTAQEVSDLYNNGRHIEESLLPSIPQTGLVAQFPLDTNAADIVGTNDGIATSITYGINGAIFNGSTSNIELGTFDWVTTAFSVSMWVVKTASRTEGLFTVGSQDYRAFSVDIESNTNIQMVASSNGSSWTTLSSNASGITINNMFHLCITGDATNTLIYINGVQKVSTVALSSILLNSKLVKIGAHYALNSSYMHTGSIDNVALFNRKITAQEVSDIYNYGR